MSESIEMLGDRRPFGVGRGARIMAAALALIYVQEGLVPANKQIEACARYAHDRGWLFSIVPAGALDQALRLISRGTAEVLLLAYHDGRAAEDIKARVAEVGGRIELCTKRRPRERHAAPPATSDWERVALRMHELGATTEEIAQLSRVPLERLRSLLHRRSAE
jgi:DNA-directed RNA polymerase specialized sigma24 family protein